MKSISDEIYETLLEKKGELEARDILKRFFKIDTEKTDVAERIVGPVLSSDPRFRRSGSGKWAAVKKETVEELPISEANFVLFQIEREQELFEELSSKGRLPGKGYFFLLYRGKTTGEMVTCAELLERVDRYIFVPYDSKSLAGLKRAYRIKSPLPPELKTISVRTLCEALFPGLPLRTWDEIVREFSIVSLEDSGPRARVHNLMGVLDHVLSAAEKRGLSITKDLLSLSVPPRKEVDFSRYGFEREWVRGLPQCAGVYTFSGREGEVIYVGKTSNLRMRIGSYFWNTGESPEKIEGILNDLYMIDCTELGSDLEAMIEEFRLIDRHRPRYNTKRSISEKKVTVSRRILIPRTLGRGMLKLYLLSDALPLMEHDYWYGGEDRRLRAVVDEFIAKEGYVFDPLKSIAISYMKRYEDNLVIIEMDRYRGGEDIERVVRFHCEDIIRGEKEKNLYI